MLTVLKQYLNSKKWVAALLATLLWCVGRFYLKLPHDDLVQAVTPLIVAIGGQALLDMVLAYVGKYVAKK